MTRPIVFRRGVNQDLSAAAQWYEQQRAGLGERFLSGIQATFESIQHYPEMYAAVYENVRRAVIPRFPYAVFYTIEPDRVVVLALLHTSRDPGLWPR